MAKQGNHLIANMSEEDSLVLSDERIYQLQGAKPKTKVERGLRTETSVMKDIPRHPMKSQEPQESMSASVGTYRGRTNVSHTSSAPLLRPSASRASPLSRKPNSAPVQMLSVFQWPAIQEKTDHNHNSQSVQSSLSQMNGKQVYKEGDHPYSLPQIRRPGSPGSARKSQSSQPYRELDKRQDYEEKRRTTLYRELDKRQDYEEKRRTTLYRESDKQHQDEAGSRTTLPGGFKNAGGLPPGRMLVMKTSQSQLASASQQRDAKTPNKQENNDREMKKAMNYKRILLYGNVRKTIVCSTKSAPSPRRSPSKTSPSFASPPPRKPSSAPVQMTPAFQWPVIQERIDQVQRTCNPSHARSRIIRHKNHGPAQKTRVRFLKTESDGAEPTPLGEARSSRKDQSVEEECFEEVFDLPRADSQTPIMVKHLQHETINRQPINGTADVEDQHGATDVSSSFVKEKPNVPKYVHDMKQRSSPDSFVALLIANSKNLTLFDSLESPTLQERKKKARALGKKFG